MIEDDDPAKPEPEKKLDGAPEAELEKPREKSPWKAFVLSLIHI